MADPFADLQAPRSLAIAFRVQARLATRAGVPELAARCRAWGPRADAAPLEVLAEVVAEAERSRDPKAAQLVRLFTREEQQAVAARRASGRRP